MTFPGPDPRLQPGANGVEPAPHPPHALVRPYMLTRGRTSSSLGAFELHAPALIITPSASTRRIRLPPLRQQTCRDLLTIS